MDKLQKIKKNIFGKYNILINNKKKFKEAIQKPLQQTFRVNQIKEEKETVLDRLKEYDSSIETTKWNDNAHITKLKNLGSSLEHFVGNIYIQELTSMIPPLIAKDLLGDIDVIDCCAAPGSKTTQLADIMDNNGTIIANDSRHGRIKALRGNLDRLGITNTSVTLRDFKSFPNTSADVYFVDAPCSSEGTIRKRNNVIRDWKDKDYQRFNKLQKCLLSKACEMAPSGSNVIYSTCTFSPEENEKVVSNALKKYDLKIEKINLRNLKTREGITQWKDDDYDKEVRKCMRIWPHDNDTNGFFVTRLLKC